VTLVIFRQVARTIDQILKSTQPNTIRFQQPTKFELVVNRKPAMGIGLVLVGCCPPAPTGLSSNAECDFRYGSFAPV
jgi:hypothetical protein